MLLLLLLLLLQRLPPPPPPPAAVPLATAAGTVSMLWFWRQVLLSPHTRVADKEVINKESRMIGIVKFSW